MPLRLHDYECGNCGWSGEIIADDNEIPNCSVCHVPLDRLLPIFKINVGPVPQHGYFDDNLQTYIHTNTQRKEVMRRQGVSEKGATPKVEQIIGDPYKQD